MCEPIENAMAQQFTHTIEAVHHIIIEATATGILNTVINAYAQDGGFEIV
jgi:hypothetical protein